MKREYVATFAIGARLLGSFRGAMAAAQARMKRLQTSAMSMGRSLLKFGSLFGAGFAAFGAIRMLQSVFKDATAEIEEQADRERKLQAMLMQNAFIRKKGVAYAKAQKDLVIANNAEMAKTGFVTADMYDNMAANLAVAGLMPKEIMKMQPALADALVAMKGINVTEEDAGQAAFMIGKAIKLGVAKPLAKLLPMMTQAQAKAFPKKSMQERFKMLMDIMKLQQGVNVEMMKDPAAQVKKLNEDLGEMAERVGAQMLPSRGKMAAAWRKVLPKLEPIITKIGGGVAKAFEKLASYIEDTVIPAFDRLSAFWTTHPELQQGIVDLAKNIGKATLAVGAFALVAAVNPMLWVAVAAAAVLLLANNWDTAARSASEYVKQQQAMGTTDSGLYKLVKLLDDFMTGLDLIGVGIDYYITEPLNKAAERLNKLSAGWRKIPGLGYLAPSPIEIQKPVAIPGARERLLKKAQPYIPEPKAPPEAMIQPTVDVYRLGAKKIMMPLQDLKTATDNVGDTTKATTPKVDNFVVQLKDVSTTAPQATTELGYLIQALQRIAGITAPSIISAGAGPASANQYVAPAAAAANGVDIPPADMSNVPGYAAGGLVTKPTFAMIGERGPEAVVPLRGRKGGGTTVHFAPTITINGNASESEQRALESKLRDLARDFVDNFKRAQRHERRLSYEGGYG